MTQNVVFSGLKMPKNDENHPKPVIFGGFLGVSGHPSPVNRNKIVFKGIPFHFHPTLF